MPPRKRRVATTVASSSKRRKLPERNSRENVISASNKHSSATIAAAFTSKALDTLFNKYKDPKDDVIGPEQMETFFNDCSVSPTSVECLVFAKVMEASKMGYFSRDEFKRGFTALKIHSLSQVKGKLQRLLNNIKKNEKSFSQLYCFAFDYCKEEANSRIVDTRLLMEMLNLLCIKRPHVEQLQHFLLAQVENGKYKVLNKDQWRCILEFSNAYKNDPLLESYNENEAWPCIFDDFVESRLLQRQ